MSSISDTTIVEINVKDLRWPTSLEGHGSDAMHTNPNYSCAYVTITTKHGDYGNAVTFTCGRGTEIIALAVRSISYLVKDRIAWDIFKNFAAFWRELTSESQLRWIGPEKGVIHLAVGVIINALWDLWAKLEGKPVWRLLTDMEPELLVSTIDFRYITDVITPSEAIEILKKNQFNKAQRIQELLTNGYPAYTTQVGWMKYSDETVRTLCRQYLAKGFDAFKIKVGQDIKDDIRRCKLIREEIGWSNILMVDANQVWNIHEAIDWMKKLAEFKPLWIEEPTSPDDILGHAAIAKALKPYGIGVATGEMCANRVLFKQFLQSDSLQYCQIDAARIGGINEILSVYLMAHKLNVKVCPHAGGVGLCEMVQHLQMWDYISLSCTKTGRYIEYVDQQHEQFIHPVIMKNASYAAPTEPGYNTEIKSTAIDNFSYPCGKNWQKLFKDGEFKELSYNNIL